MSKKHRSNDLPALSVKIKRAAARLHMGAVIAYPTEGLWGLGCDPSNRFAVNRILALKSRPVSKGMILVADSVERLSPFFRYLPDENDLRVEGRPVTWLLEHGQCSPDWITGGRETLAIRISKHPIIAGLCACSGLPLVSTSANPAGKEPAKTSLRVRSYFGNLIDVIVPGALGGQNGASEIRDFQTGRVLREAG